MRFIKTVIFDYDGVLVDSLDSCLPRWNKISRELGDASVIDRKLVQREWAGGWQNFYSNFMGVPEEKIPEANDLYRSMVAQESLPEFFAGISEAVRSLAKRFTLYIISASSTETIEANLKRAGLRQFFLDVHGQDKSPELRKSDPEFVRRPLRGWGVEASNTCTIGDTADEIKAGREAGLRTIACTWGWNDRILLETQKPTILIDSPVDLPRAVEQLENY